MSRDEINCTREVKGTTQREVSDVQKRALRRVGTASSALSATPQFSSGQPQGWMAGALGEHTNSALGPVRRVQSKWVAGALGLEPSDLSVRGIPGRRMRLPQLLPNEDKRPLRESPRRPAGPPFLLLIPLYDWRNEGLHEVFDGLSVQLDDASGIDVLIEIVASPADLHVCYQALRSAELAKRDEADARAYVRKLRKGSSAETDRRIEVDKLAKRLGIPPEKLPCIAVLPFPLSLPVEAVKIDEDWFKTERSPKQLATALEGFFKSQSVRELITEASTNLDLAKEYSGLMQEWLARRLRVERVPSHAQLDQEGWYTPIRLAESFGVDKNALRKRLDRFRERNLNGWKQNEDRRMREPMYLYRLSDVMLTIEKLRASTERPSS